ncbi:hypothetical protein PanWU01x14_167070 [Parasponia andersonii]|uniref:Uncharacterized protein n=1 Tax=Parasponia andersonii TaxID=3476 RepID=A0A2P5CBE0_PARAD|nr:hypothetical protein PanWU01x14_167070 [Parasponia andersonii]
MASSRMTTRSTRPDAEESSREARPGLEQKLDQMLAALTKANWKAEMAHEAILNLKDEVAEVCRDNAHLEGLLASEARSRRREDFDEEVKQESGSQPPREVPAPSRSRIANRTRDHSDGLCRLDPAGAQAEKLHNSDLQTFREIDRPPRSHIPLSVKDGLGNQGRGCDLQSLLHHPAIRGRPEVAENHVRPQLVGTNCERVFERILVAYPRGDVLSAQRRLGISRELVDIQAKSEEVFRVLENHQKAPKASAVITTGLAQTPTPQGIKAYADPRTSSKAGSPNPRRSRRRQE